MFYVYILKSLKDGHGYVGTANDVDKRLRRHNTGSVKSTRFRKPFVLVRKEEYDTLSEARKREWFLKYTPEGGKLKRKILGS